MGSAGTCSSHCGFLLVAHNVRGEISQPSVSCPLYPPEAGNAQQLPGAEQAQLHSPLARLKICKGSIKISLFQHLPKMFWMLSKSRPKHSPPVKTDPLVFPEHPLPLRQCCCYSLAIVPCIIIAVIAQLSLLCKLNIPAHLSHYLSKSKHQSKYELRLG